MYRRNKYTTQKKTEKTIFWIIYLDDSFEVSTSLEYYLDLSWMESWMESYMAVSMEDYISGNNWFRDKKLISDFLHLFQDLGSN